MVDHFLSGLMYFVPSQRWREQVSKHHLNRASDHKRASKSSAAQTRGGAEPHVESRPRTQHQPHCGNRALLKLCWKRVSCRTRQQISDSLKGKRENHGCHDCKKIVFQKCCSHYSLRVTFVCKKKKCVQKETDVVGPARYHVSQEIPSDFRSTNCHRCSILLRATGSA